MKKHKCCHDITSKESTIKILNKRFMVDPDIIYGVCKCCGKPFEYKKTDKK